MAAEEEAVGVAVGVAEVEAQLWQWALAPVLPSAQGSAWR